MTVELLSVFCDDSARWECRPSPFHRRHSPCPGHCSLQPSLTTNRLYCKYENPCPERSGKNMALEFPRQLSSGRLVLKPRKPSLRKKEKRPRELVAELVCREGTRLRGDVDTHVVVRKKKTSPPPSALAGGEAEGNAQAEVQPAEGRDGRDGAAKEKARGADGSGERKNNNIIQNLQTQRRGDNLRRDAYVPRIVVRECARVGDCCRLRSEFCRLGHDSDRVRDRGGGGNVRSGGGVRCLLYGEEVSPPTRAPALPRGSIREPKGNSRFCV